MEEDLGGRQFEVLSRLKQGLPNSEWEVLDVFVQAWRRGEEITPLFQEVINALLAKAVLQQSLPPQPKGRRSNPASGFDIASAYFDLVDQGASATDAAEAVSARFHKDVRQIYRVVRAWKDFYGDEDERAAQRTKWATVGNLIAENYPGLPLEADSLCKLNDPIEGVLGINNQIALILARLPVNDAN